MTRRTRWSALAVAGLVTIVATFPMSLALALVLPKENGLVAREVSGTIWSGRLHDARIAGVSLGDTRVGVAPVELFRLVGELRFAAPELTGRVRAAGNAVALTEAQGTIEPGDLLNALPITKVVLNQFSVAFLGDRCAWTAGTVQANVAPIAGVAIAETLSGAPKCVGSAVVIPLVAPSGAGSVELRLTRRGSWRARIALRADDPALAVRLDSVGFTSAPDGRVLTLSGSL